MRKGEDTRKVIEAAGKEYKGFKKRIMRRGKNHIWKESGKIQFYSTVMEYFKYCQSGQERYWRILRGQLFPISAMWACYLKHEHLEYSTWNRIEGILIQMESDYITAETTRNQGNKTCG